MEIDLEITFDLLEIPSRFHLYIIFMAETHPANRAQPFSVAEMDFSDRSNRLVTIRPKNLLKCAKVGHVSFKRV